VLSDMRLPLFIRFPFGSVHISGSCCILSSSLLCAIEPTVAAPFKALCSLAQGRVSALIFRHHSRRYVRSRTDDTLPTGLRVLKTARFIRCWAERMSEGL